MSITFSKPDVNRDLIDATANAIFLLVGVLTATTPGDYLKIAPRTYGHLNKILKAVKPEDDAAPENLAWSWLAMTLSEATSQFVIELRKEVKLNAKIKESSIRAFVKNAMELDESAQFDEDIFHAPKNHMAFAAARLALPKLIHDITPWTKYDRNVWQNTFSQCLKRAAQYVSAARHHDFHSIIDVVSGPASDGRRREAAWARHTQWLHHRFTETPVFSPDGSVKTPLCELYLHLRCYWHSTVASTEDGTEEIKTKWSAHVGNLHEELENWAFSDNNDNIRVIAGGPGSGKSSFAKAFASEVAYRNQKRVIFIELQRLQMTGNLRGDIQTYMEIRNNQTIRQGSAGFPENPLNWLKSDDLSALLVFDGLDELTHDTELAKQKSSDFILQAKRLVAEASEDGVQIKAMILGRNLSCQDGLKAASLPLHTMFNVAPIHPLDVEDIKPHTNEHRTGLSDGLELPKLDGIFAVDQRPIYWAKWAQSLGTPTQGMPDAVTHSELSDLNAEPLLLHLLILSDFCGDRWMEAADNRNLVYEDILTKIQERNSTKGVTKKDLELDDFMLLMECLGITAWRGNGRAGEEETFNSVRDVHARHRRKVLSDIDAAKMENIIIHAHARRVEGDRPGFEFIHKSFGEYLAARGLVSLALITARRMSNSEDPQDEPTMARAWIEIVDNGMLTEEVARFIKDEARRRYSSDMYMVMKEQLETLLTWVLHNGFPINQESVGNFRELEEKQRNAEMSVLALGTSIAHSINQANGPIQKPSYFSPQWSFIELRYFITRILNGNLRMRPEQLLHDLDLGMHFQPQWAGSLTTPNFSNSNLFGAQLTRNEFVHANLAFSNSQHIQLAGSIFHSGSFNKADLRDAAMDGARFYNVDFTDAIMIGADLDNVDADGSNFNGAIFDQNTVRGATFKNAHNLSTNQVGCWFGVKSGYGKTMLPSGMSAPDFWHEAAEANEDNEELIDAYNEHFKKWANSKSDDES